MLCVRLTVEKNKSIVLRPGAGCAKGGQRIVIFSRAKERHKKQ